MKTCSKCGLTKLLDKFRFCKGKPRSECKACAAEYNRRWYEENVEKQREYSRRQRRENPEKHRERVQCWYKANPFNRALQDSRDKAKKRNHTPCLATPEQLKAVYTGLCHFCGKSEKENGKRLSLDHCHETGEFRGFLCNKCNLKNVFALTV